MTLRGLHCAARQGPRGDPLSHAASEYVCNHHAGRRAGSQTVEFEKLDAHGFGSSRRRVSSYPPTPRNPHHSRLGIKAVKKARTPPSLTTRGSRRGRWLRVVHEKDQQGSDRVRWSSPSRGGGAVQPEILYTSTLSSLGSVRLSMKTHHAARAAALAAPIGHRGTERPPPCPVAAGHPLSLASFVLAATRAQPPPDYFTSCRIGVGWSGVLRVSSRGSDRDNCVRTMGHHARRRLWRGRLRANGSDAARRAGGVAAPSPTDPAGGQEAHRGRSVIAAFE
jgi:hypothetical protein